MANFKDTAYLNQRLTNTKAISRMGNIMVMGSTLGAQETPTKAPMKMAKSMDTAYTLTLMDPYTKENGLEANATVKGYKYRQREEYKKHNLKWVKGSNPKVDMHSFF